MPNAIPGVTIVVKNLASGNFQFLVQNPNGGVRMCFVLLAADMATAAALSSASATFTYGQDGANPTGPLRVDYPNSYVMETG